MTNRIGSIHRFLKQRASMLLIAFMLGISNVILEETRMINDSANRMEQVESLPDEDLLDTQKTILKW